MPQEFIKVFGYQFPVFIPDGMRPSFEEFRSSDYWKFVNKAYDEGAIGVMHIKKRHAGEHSYYWSDVMAMMPALYTKKSVAIFTVDSQYIRRVAETIHILLQCEIRIDKVFRKDPQDNRRLIFDEISWEVIGVELLTQTSKQTGYRLSVVTDIDNSFHPHESF